MWAVAGFIEVEIEREAPVLERAPREDAGRLVVGVHVEGPGREHDGRTESQQNLLEFLGAGGVGNERPVHRSEELDFRPEDGGGFAGLLGPDSAPFLHGLAAGGEFASGHGEDHDLVAFRDGVGDQAAAGGLPIVRMRGDDD